MDAVAVRSASLSASLSPLDAYKRLTSHMARNTDLFLRSNPAWFLPYCDSRI